MLPFDYCCSSVKKELKKRTCKVCNQYIPSAYRMKNHYKIHAEHYEDYDFEQDDTLPNTNGNQQATTTTTTTTAAAAVPPVFKTEMLDWLRSDFDDFDLGSTSNQLANDHVQEKNDQNKNKD